MKKNNKGFTLAELLIVVAIIAVLVAVAIPIFSTQLEKSKEATDIANVRNAYAELTTQYLTDNGEHSMTVQARQAKSGWTGESGYIVIQKDQAQTNAGFSAKYGTGQSYSLYINSTGSLYVDDVLMG